MDYKVVSKITIPKGSPFKRIGEFLYFPKIDGIAYKGPYAFPVELLISEGLSKCEVTPAFLKLPFIMKGWINLDILLREIDVMKLALQDKLLLHASCIDHTLIVGFPNSGKTYYTYKKVSEGKHLVSEEYTILDKAGYAHPYKACARSCLSARTLKDSNLKLSFKEKVALGAATVRATILPFMFEAAIWKSIPVSGDIERIERIIYGSSEVTVDSWKQRALLTDNEFPFANDAFLQAYAFGSGLDILGIQTKQRKLMKEIINVIYHHPEP